MADILDLDKIRKERIDDLLDSSIRESSTFIDHTILHLPDSTEEDRRELEKAEKILDSDPENLEALCEIALIISEYDIDSAKEIYRKVLSLDPENVTAYSVLGSIYYLQLDDPKIAEKCYQKAIALSKPEERSSTINDLALMYVERGEFDKALPLYEESLRLDDRAINKFYLGSTYVALQRFDEAIPLLEEAKDASLKKFEKRDIPELLFMNNCNQFTNCVLHLITAYAKSGELDSARENYQMLLRSPYLSQKPLEIKRELRRVFPDIEE